MAARPNDVRLEPGTRVEVRRRFDRRWARGFEVAEVLDGPRYTLRRRSDGSVLPTPFGDDEVREERRNTDMWWY